MLKQSYSDNLTSKPKHLRSNDPYGYPAVGALLQLGYFIIGAGAIPIRLLIRKNFGERSIPPLALLVSLVFHTYYVLKYVSIYNAVGLFLRDLFQTGSLSQMNSWGTLEFVIFISAFVINFYTYYLLFIFFRKGRLHLQIIINSAKHKKVKISSYYRGEGIYFRKRLGKRFKTPLGHFIVDERIQRMLVEPWEMMKFGFKLFGVSLLLSIGLAMISFSLFTQVLMILSQSLGATSIMIVLSAICLFLEELGIFLRIRGAALDILDGEEDLRIILEQKANLLVEEADRDEGNPVFTVHQFPEVRF